MRAQPVSEGSPPMSTRPNDRCPCGSGKKVKRCCRDHAPRDGDATFPSPSKGEGAGGEGARCLPRAEFPSHSKGDGAGARGEFSRAGEGARCLPRATFPSPSKGEGAGGEGDPCLPMTAEFAEARTVLTPQYPTLITASPSELLDICRQIAAENICAPESPAAPAPLGAA
ncbi:MAG: SEC-C domain-containing protein, partial [Planctomycetes bacterium]|nr:SEC-C domain-containing protein [Planctomycetota bacterium]